MRSLHEKVCVPVIHPTSEPMNSKAREKESGMVLLYFVFLLGMLTLLATMLSSSVLPGASAAHDTLMNEQLRARVEIARNVLYAFTTVRSDGERVMEKEIFNLFKDLKSEEIEFNGDSAANASSASNASASSAWKISVWKVEEVSDGKGRIHFRVPGQLRKKNDTLEQKQMLDFWIVESNAEASGDTTNTEGDNSASAASPSKGTSQK